MLTKLIGWHELIQTCIPSLVHPAMVTISSVTPTTGVTFEWKASAADIRDDVARSSFRLSTSNNVQAVDGQERAYVYHAPYPCAVHQEQSSDSVIGLPQPRSKLYYSLASSSVYYPEPMCLSTSESRIQEDRCSPASSYKIDLLAVGTHALSTYNRQLSSHMIDVTQSFVDLYVLAKHRWSLNYATEHPHGVGKLPWHLVAISTMPNFMLDSLLPS